MLELDIDAQLLLKCCLKSISVYLYKIKFTIRNAHLLYQEISLHVK